MSPNEDQNIPLMSRIGPYCWSRKINKIPKISYRQVSKSGYTRENLHKFVKTAQISHHAMSHKRITSYIHAQQLKY